MPPNTASLTRRLWLWLLPAVYRPPAYHPTGPWTWPCKKGDAGRQQVTGRRERCGKAVYGNAAEEKRSATEALELSKGREVQYAAGLALAFSGESSRSEAVASDLEKRFPEDAFVKLTYTPYSVTRKASEIVRSEYSAITEHEWKLLLHELRLLSSLHIHKAITYGFTS